MKNLSIAGGMLVLAAFGAGRAQRSTRSAAAPEAAVECDALGASSASPRETQPAELPLRIGREEVAVARAHVAGRRGARAAAQHELVAHELAVVFADGARQRPIARIGRGRPTASTPRRRRTSAPARRRPARSAAADGRRRDRRSCRAIGARQRARRELPFELGRQAGAGPARVGVGLEVAEVADRRVRVDLDRCPAGCG